MPIKVLTSLVIAFTCVILAVVIITKTNIERLSFNQREANARTALDLVSLSIQDQFNRLVNYEVELVKKQRALLFDNNALILAALRVFHSLAAAGELTDNQAKEKALDWIKKNSTGPQLSIIDEKLVGLYHPDPMFVGKSWTGYRDIRGNDAFRTIHSILTRQENLYSLIYMQSPHSKLMLKYLTFSTAFPDWGWTITSFTPMDKAESEVNHQVDTVVMQLTSIFKRSQANLAGQLTLFSGDGSVLIPLSTPEGLTSLPQGATISQEAMEKIKKAATQTEMVQLPTSYFFTNAPTGYRSAFVSHFVPLDWYITYSLSEDSLHTPGQILATRNTLILIIIFSAIFLMLFILLMYAIRPLSILARSLSNFAETHCMLSEEQHRSMTLLSKCGSTEIRRIANVLLSMHAALSRHHIESTASSIYSVPPIKLDAAPFGAGNSTEASSLRSNVERKETDAGNMSAMKPEAPSNTAHDSPLRAFLKAIKRPKHEPLDVESSTNSHQSTTADHTDEHTLHKHRPAFDPLQETPDTIVDAPIPFHLGELITSLRVAISPTLEKAGLHLVYHIESGLDLNRRGDPTTIKHILLSLLTDVTKEAKQGQIWLEVSALPIPIHFSRDDAVTFKISNTEIAAEEGQSMFHRTSFDPSHEETNPDTSPHVQIETARLVKALGGKLHFFRNDDGGITAVISLSLPRFQHMAPIHPKIDIQSAMRILAVDDNEPNLHLLRLYLEKENVILETARNGQEALDKFMSTPFDAVLMDVEIPVMDGPETTRRIRQFEAQTNRPAVPIIALTAHAFEQFRTICKDAGCTDFIAKPFKKTQLLDSLRRWVRQSDSTTSA